MFSLFHVQIIDLTLRYLSQCFSYRFFADVSNGWKQQFISRMDVIAIFKNCIYLFINSCLKVSFGGHYFQYYVNILFIEFISVNNLGE